MSCSMAKLTEKQLKFVDEYLVDLNATKAAIRAGYSVKTAEQQGYQLLHKTSVANEIAKAQAKLSKRTGISQERILRELAKIAFLNLSDIVEWGPEGIKLKDSSEVDGTVLQSVTETWLPKGGTKTEVKAHDKAKALELLGKHLGMWVDKTEITGAQPVKIVDDLDD